MSVESAQSRDPNRTLVLLRTAADGDQTAWEELFRTHRPLMEALVHSRLPRSIRAREDTEDVVQSACLTAFHSLPSFEYKGADSFRNWITEILSNKLKDRVKHHSRQRRAVQREVDRDDNSRLLAEEHDDSDSPSAIAAMAESQALMFEAITRLPEEAQDLVCQRLFMELSWKDIADAHHISETHARRRALQAMEDVVRSML